MLPVSPPERNSQLVHPAPECIWMKSEDLCSSSWPVDLAAGHLQSLFDVLDSHLVQRNHGAIPARVTSHFMSHRNRGGQRSFYSAQQNLITVRLTRLTNQVTLYKVLGGVV